MLSPFGRETLAYYEAESAGGGYQDQQQSSATGGALQSNTVPNFQGTSTYSNHDSYEGAHTGRKMENIIIHNVDTDSYGHEEEKYDGRNGAISVVPLSIGFKGNLKDRRHLSGMFAKNFISL
jgi:hypothetical protein